MPQSAEAARPARLAPDLSALFSPASVAVVGASDDARRIGGRVLGHLRRYGYDGELHAVNPKYRSVQGMPCVASVTDLPGPIDLAIVAVPAPAVSATLEECGRRGCRFAVIFSAGFAEVGGDGVALQAAAVETAARWGIRLLGPNALGLISEPARLGATFATVLDRDYGLLSGNAAFVSQSGAFGAYIYALAQEQGVGLRHFVSVGNEADLTVADVIAHLAADPGTDVIGGYVEGVRDGRALLDAARSAGEAGKRVALMKVGRSDAARRAIASHTAALAGPDTVYDAAFQRAGVTRVASVQDMLDFMRWSAQPLAGAGVQRVAVLTLSGGAGIWAADELARLGLGLADLNPGTQAELRSILPPFGSVGNPVDCTGQILAQQDMFGRCLTVLAADPGVDSVLLLLGLQEHDGEKLARDVVAAGRETETPLVVGWMAAPRQALELLRESSIPTFEDFERAIRWLAVASTSARRLEGLNYGRPAPVPRPQPALQVPMAEHEAKRQLGDWGLNVPEGRLVDAGDDAVGAARELGYPVALKGQSAAVVHKSELGLVWLGLADDAEVAAAFESVWAAMAAAGLDDPKVLVEPMAADGLDVIVSAEMSVFGPLVMFGLGGVQAELLGDVVFRLAPVGVAEAHEMIGEIRGAALLEGFRGAQPMDRDALAEAIVEVAAFAVAHAATVDTVEVNPLRVLPAGDGVLVLDALIA